MTNYYEYINSICDEIMQNAEHWDEHDLLEIAISYANDSQFVLYYSQAHDFVQWLPTDIRYQAEDEVADCSSGEYTDYNTLASRIACFALESMIFQEITNRLEKQKVA